MKTYYNLLKLTVVSSGKWIVMVLVTHLLVGGVFHIQYFKWHVYMMYGYILIAFLTSFYFNKEIKAANKYILYSLPVKKQSIVYFRYILSFLIFVVCLALWFFNCYAFNKIWQEQLTWFSDIFYIKVVFMASLFFVIQQSLFLPSVFIFKMPGIIISFVLSITAAITSIPVLFYPYSSRYTKYFYEQDITQVVVLSFLMFVMIVSSLYISNKLNISRDL